MAAPRKTSAFRVRSPPAELHLLTAAFNAEVRVFRPRRGVPVPSSAVRSASKEPENVVRGVVMLCVAEEFPFGPVVV